MWDILLDILTFTVIGFFLYQAWAEYKSKNK